MPLQHANRRRRQHAAGQAVQVQQRHDHALAALVGIEAVSLECGSFDGSLLTTVRPRVSSFVAFAFGEPFGGFVDVEAALDGGGQTGGGAAEAGPEAQAERGDVHFGEVILDGSYGRACHVLW
jgi:hypothetical protein